MRRRRRLACASDRRLKSNIIAEYVRMALFGFHHLLLDRRKDAIAACARHSDHPQNANARIWHVDQSLFRARSLGKGSQFPNFADNRWSELGMWRCPVVPVLGNF